MANTVPGKLKEIAVGRGVELEALISETIAETGSVLQAARVLNVAPNSIHEWLKSNHFRVDVKRVASLVKVKNGA